MKTINIAEILVDYPKGTKLYSPIFGDVYLDKVRPHLAVVVVILKEDEKSKEEFLYDGRYTINGECMLFPSKEDRDWESYELFKKGDIVVSKAGNIAMYSHCENDVVYYQCTPSPLRPEVNADGMLCYKIPDGYQSFSIQGGMIILKPIKSKYPKTFEECLNMLYCKSVLRTIIGHKAELLLNLEKLLISRDAYWKIAGEEMGLGKPWEPDWLDKTTKYGIWPYQNTIIKDNAIRTNRMLVFPTLEIRDVFYENFKDLIEQCKELL